MLKKRNSKFTVFYLFIYCFATLSNVDASKKAVTYGPILKEAKTDITLHVSKSAQGKPEKTKAHVSIQSAIDAAVTHLSEGRSVTVKIAAGTYHESPRLEVNGLNNRAKNTLLIIEGSSDAKVIISGLEPNGFVPSAWRKVKGTKNIYEHTWNRNYGLNWGPEPDRVGKLPAPALIRRELMVVDGRVLLQKELCHFKWVDPDGSLKIRKGGKVTRNSKTRPGKMVFSGISKAGLGVLDAPWTFIVADQPGIPKELRNKIYVRLPDEKDMGSIKRIGVSRLVSKEVIQDTAETDNDALFKVSGKRNLVIRNIKLQHAGTALYGAALSLDSVEGLLLENVTASHNNGSGLKTNFLKNFTIRNCSFEYNGKNGAEMRRQTTNGRVLNSSFSFNQDRAYAHKYEGATQAGMKIVAGARNVQFRKCIALGNRRGGFWTDAFCNDVIYEHCLAMGNGGFGYFLEWSWDKGQGDVVRRCVSAFNETGIRMGEVCRPHIENNLLLFNDKSIVVRNVPTRSPSTPQEFGYTRVVGNDIYNRKNGVAVLVMDGTNLLPTMECNRNRYFYDSKEKPFQVLGGRDKGGYDFGAWQKLLAQNTSKGFRGSESIFKRVSFKAKPESLFNKKSIVYAKAVQLEVPLPVGKMNTALKRYAEMTDRDSSYADW